MKAFLLFICTLLKLCSVQTETFIQPISTATPSPPPPVKNIEINGERFTYDFFIVTAGNRLSLIPNFTHPSDTETLIKNNGCTSAVNGGFYDRSNKPLGYFQTGSKIYGRQIPSDLVNGFLWSVSTGSAVISSDLPHADYLFALQTGPVLLFNGSVMPLTVHNDEHARRMLAGKTSDNNLIFITIYDEKSVYEGPLLGNVPDIITAINKKESLGLEDAINLDGGSASFFYSGNTSLSELTPIGSLFCIR